MKPKIFQLISCTALAAATLINTSCMTTYDRYGRPVQSVDPVVAVGAAAATGAIAYSAGRNQKDYRANCRPPYRPYGYNSYGKVNHTYANQREAWEYQQREGYRRMVQSDDYRHQTECW